MREIRTSGLMSGAGNRGGGIRQYPRPASTLPCRRLPPGATSRANGHSKGGDAGKVTIGIYAPTRSVKITDNGTGIPYDQFVHRLTAFGASRKRGRAARGFRGVGRLAGLGYCQELVFRNSSRKPGSTRGASASCTLATRVSFPTGRRDHFEQSVHYDNLLTHLTPVAREITRRCRVNSVQRKWSRDFELRETAIREKAAIIKQGAMSRAARIELRRRFESASPSSRASLLKRFCLRMW